MLLLDFHSATLYKKINESMCVFAIQHGHTGTLIIPHPVSTVALVLTGEKKKTQQHPNDVSL